MARGACSKRMVSSADANIFGIQSDPIKRIKDKMDAIINPHKIAFFTASLTLENERAQ